MSRIVIDCSVTMAWCFEDESDAYADSVLDALTSDEAVDPSLWSLEVANVLLVGERRGRLTPADTARFVNLLQALPIAVDPETSKRALDKVLLLARQHNLSSYDGAYLELAMRTGAPLCTLDDRLRHAAQAVGVSFFQSPSSP